EIRDHDEPIGVNLEVPRRLVAERAQGRAAALRIGPRHLARIRATVRERSAGDLERRELALVPVDRFAVLVAHARVGLRDAEDDVLAADRLGHPQSDLPRSRAYREALAARAVEHERAA